MPSDTSGFTGTELVNYAKSWIGNTSSGFQSFLETTLVLAEFRYCKSHEWAFLEKTNLSLTVASGTDEYALSVANVGYFLKATNVRNVFSVANNLYLKKTTLDAIRRMDPNSDDGSSTSSLRYWAPIGDNRIIVWPKTFSDTTLKIDGRISPGALSTLSNYPTIPYEHQDTFIQYYLALALQREDDARAEKQMLIAEGLIKKDIQADLAEVADSEQLRIKHRLEASGDGISPQVDPLNMLWEP